MSSKYHVAIILYKSSSDANGYVPMFEESITLIKANTEAEARKSAECLAHSRGAKFKNEKGEEITWVFDKIIDIAPMLEDNLKDVTEIYSRHFANINAYKQFEELAD